MRALCAASIAAWLAACFAVCSAVAAPARAGVAPEIEVEARFDREARRVDGVLHLALDNPSSAPLERVYLWLYPSHTARPPEGLDDVNHHWVYPRTVDLGGMELLGVGARAEPHAIAGGGALVSVALPAPLAPGGSVALTLRFRARVPRRYGVFGCAEGLCTLAAFHPVPARLDAAGWDLEAPPPPRELRATLQLDPPADVVLLGQPSGGPTSRHRAVGRAEYATAVIAERWHASQRRVGGRDVRVLRPEPPPPAQPDDLLLPYSEEDHAAQALDVIEGALAAARAAGHALAGEASITVVEAPLRARLASAQPGVVLLSDRFHRLWPAARFRKFHDRQLARAVFAALVAPVARGRGVDRWEVADVVASYLTDVYTVHEHARREFVDTILRPVSFVPMIDQLLYAPQTAFAGAYFSGVRAEAPFRDDPRRFQHQRPRGRFLYEKLRDLLTGPALRRLMVDLARGAVLEDAAARAHGGSLAWFFRQWSLPPPRVNLRLVSWGSQPGPGGFRHRIVVAKEVAPGDVAPVEVVEVRAVDAAGRVRRLRWDGRGSRRVFELTTPAPLAEVTVDPGRRVDQRALPGDTEHPRAGDRQPAATRFVYNSFGVLLNVSDLSALLAADFTLGRAYDRRHLTRFLIYTSASTRLGGGVSHRLAFGPPVTPDRLLWALRGGLYAARLNSGFFAAAGDDDRPASRFSARVALGADDRLSLFEPMQRRELGLSLSLDVTRRDAVAAGPEADTLLTGSVSGGVSATTTPREGHTLAAELRGAAVVGDVRARSQLVEVGGAGGVRGYAPGAIFARAAAIGRAEYRHTFVRGLDWNWGFYTYVRGLGGAAFADAALLSGCDGLDPADVRWAGTVGYGVRSFYDSLGTLPALLRLDAALGLAEGQGTCLGRPAPLGRSVQIYLTFVPPF